jgi:hypothetical protein
MLHVLGALSAVTAILTVKLAVLSGAFGRVVDFTLRSGVALRTRAIKVTV